MIRPKILPPMVSLLVMAAAMFGAAGPEVLTQGGPDRPRLVSTQYKLSNGLQVILAEDYRLPVVSVVVAYRVGSANDPQGKAGLAYLLENLMFLGSADVSQMQHIGFINRVGGFLSATVKEDRTLFYQTVPANHLGLVLWLESDRMRFLQLSAAKVESSKTSLIGEIHQRTLQDPYTVVSQAFDRLLYPGYASAHPVFGLENDLRTITEDEARNFYDTYYAPNNAVLCICGNINKIKTRELVARYFESLPRGKESPSSPAPERFDRISRTEDFRDPRVQVPGFWLGFRAPLLNPEDIYGLTVLDYILFRGRNSRIYQRLWQKERLVLSMAGGLERRSGYLAFRFFAMTTNALLTDRSLRAIFAELQGVKSSFIGSEELAKVQSLLTMDYFNRQATTQEKAVFLAEAFLLTKRFEDFPSELDKYFQVTPQLLVGLANRYFTSANAIMATVNSR